jgi:hypothetical protein
MSLSGKYRDLKNSKESSSSSCAPLHMRGVQAGLEVSTKKAMNIFIAIIVIACKQ